MNRQRVMDQLVMDEGLRLKPYRCPAGKLTIGVGRNLDDRGITKPESMFLLGDDVDECWAQLCKALPWLTSAPEPVQEALVNMAFNLGMNGLLGFKRTIALIQTGQYVQAADAMLASRWALQVGDRARRLADMVRGCAPKEH